MRVSDETLQRCLKQPEDHFQESLAADLRDTRAALRAARKTIQVEHAALVKYHGHNEADCETCALLARIADIVDPRP